MKKIVILISSILLLVSLAFAVTLEEYVAAINQRIAEGCRTNQKVIKDWKDGIKESFGCDLDHLGAVFVLLEARQIETKMLLFGVLTVTAYATKDGQKVRVIQVSSIMYCINKDNIVEDKAILGTDPPKILEGWIGINT